MWEWPPYTCDPFDPEPVAPWVFLADDGTTVLSRLTANKCNADYACGVFNGLQMYPPNVNITCYRDAPVDPTEDPPVDPT